MVDRTAVCGGLGPVAMKEEHQSSEDGKGGKRNPPPGLCEPSCPPQQFDQSSRQEEDRIQLVLDDLPVGAEERLDETERADRPGLVIAPDQQETSRSEHRHRQQKTKAGEGGERQGIPEFAEDNKEKKHPGGVEVKI